MTDNVGVSQAPTVVTHPTNSIEQTFIEVDLGSGGSTQPKNNSNHPSSTGQKRLKQQADRYILNESQPLPRLELQAYTSEKIGNSKKTTGLVNSNNPQSSSNHPNQHNLVSPSLRQNNHNTNADANDGSTWLNLIRSGSAVQISQAAASETVQSSTEKKHHSWQQMQMMASSYEGHQGPAAQMMGFDKQMQQVQLQHQHPRSQVTSPTLNLQAVNSHNSPHSKQLQFPAPQQKLSFQTVTNIGAGSESRVGVDCVPVNQANNNYTQQRSFQDKFALNQALLLNSQRDRGGVISDSNNTASQMGACQTAINTTQNTNNNVLVDSVIDRLPSTKKNSIIKVQTGGYRGLNVQKRLSEIQNPNSSPEISPRIRTEQELKINDDGPQAGVIQPDKTSPRKQKLFTAAEYAESANFLSQSQNKQHMVGVDGSSNVIENRYPLYNAAAKQQTLSRSNQNFAQFVPFQQNSSSHDPMSGQIKSPTNQAHFLYGTTQNSLVKLVSHEEQMLQQAALQSNMNTQQISQNKPESPSTISPRKSGLKPANHRPAPLGAIAHARAHQHTDDMQKVIQEIAFRHVFNPSAQPTLSSSNQQAVQSQQVAAQINNGVGLGGGSQSHNYSHSVGIQQQQKSSYLPMNSMAQTQSSNAQQNNNNQRLTSHHHQLALAAMNLQQPHNSHQMTHLPDATSTSSVSKGAGQVYGLNRSYSTKKKRTFVGSPSPLQKQWGGVGLGVGVLPNPTNQLHKNSNQGEAHFLMDADTTRILQKPEVYSPVNHNGQNQHHGHNMTTQQVNVRSHNKQQTNPNTTSDLEERLYTVNHVSSSQQQPSSHQIQSAQKRQRNGQDRVSNGPPINNRSIQVVNTSNNKGSSSSVAAVGGHKSQQKSAARRKKQQ